MLERKSPTLADLVDDFAKLIALGLIFPFIVIALVGAAEWLGGAL